LGQEQTHAPQQTAASFDHPESARLKIEAAKLAKVELLLHRGAENFWRCFFLGW
jgi:hypothetical protein